MLLEGGKKRKVGKRAVGRKEDDYEYLRHIYCTLYIAVFGFE
jgi:hypothetical protein